MPESLSHEQVEILTSRGIPVDPWPTTIQSVHTDSDLPPEAPEYWTEANGYLPGLIFWWHSPDGETVVPQLRPDVPPIVDRDVKKYVFPPGAPSILNDASGQGPKPDDDVTTVLITEGTCQTLAAALVVPRDVAVYGIAGCQSWMKCGVPTRDLCVVTGRDVLIALDADASTNLNVYDAGVSLREACLAEGALSVRFLRVPGGGKSGLDDVLGGRSPEARAQYLANLIQLTRDRKAAEKPELPASTKPKARGSAAGPASPFFSEGGSLKVKTLTETIIGSRPVALTRENKIAIYRNGTFVIDGSAFLAEVTTLLGEQYRTSHETNAESYALGMLKAQGMVLPDRQTEPLMNVRNGMVDLRTGELLPHDPSYMSTVQFPVEWDPDATAPVYEQWARQIVGDQLDDLEEAAGTMLDPSVTPTKAIFLFGPSRSGKGTFIRIVQSIAGPENTSGVSLHQLAENRFMTANLYGKTLNVSADLSAAHVEDISIFKMMTGEDLITADRKFGHQFSFTNRALFIFSANELPTVGESSRAYSERIKPFHFNNSFAGAEDPTVELQMLHELPGILVRLQRAYRRRLERGRPLPTDPAVREKFELASDRVRQFVMDCCEIIEPETGRGGTKGGRETTITELYNAFREWAADEGKASMAKSKMKARLTSVPGVIESVSSGKSRGWNLRVRPRAEWGQQVERGTLYFSPITPTSRATFSSQDHLEKGVVVQGRGDGSEVQSSTPPADPLASLLPLAQPVEPGGRWRTCPDCDQAEELTPTGWLWACRGCHSDSFVPRPSVAARKGV